MCSAYSQISLSLKRKEMNHKLNFYPASGSSQTLTEFPGAEEPTQSSGMSSDTRARSWAPHLPGSLPVPGTCFRRRIWGHLNCPQIRGLC